jgi:hypothetical protein
MVFCKEEDMSVVCSRAEEKITLELDNGDASKFSEVIENWKFKDEQSFLRFALSLFILNEEKSFKIKLHGSENTVVPADHQLKTSD